MNNCPAAFFILEASCSASVSRCVPCPGLSHPYTSRTGVTDCQHSDEELQIYIWAVDPQQTKTGTRQSTWTLGNELKPCQVLLWLSNRDFGYDSVLDYARDSHVCPPVHVPPSLYSSPLAYLMVVIFVSPSSPTSISPGLQSAAGLEVSFIVGRAT